MRTRLTPSVRTQGASWYSLHQNSLNTLAHGRKRWFLTPPSQAFFSTQSSAEWLRGLNETTIGRKREAGALFECVQQPGDVLFLPLGWGHATFNEKLSLGISVEFDFCVCGWPSCSPPREK